MPSIADVYISVFPETSKIAEGIKAAMAKVDGKETGRRLGREIQEGIGNVTVDVDADTTQAKAEIDSIGDKNVTVKVDVDRSGLDRFLGGGGGGGRGGFGGGSGGFGPSALSLNVGLVGIGLLPAAATAIADVAGALQQLAGAGFVVPGIFAGIAASVGTAALGMHGMKDAFDAVTKAADGTQASVDAANKALGELSPNAAETVKTVVGLKGTFTELRDIASENMFAGVSDGLKDLVGNLLPAATRGIDGISKGLNQNLLQAFRSLGSTSSQGFLDRIFGNTADAQAKLSAAIDPVIHAIGTLTAAGSDGLPRLADAVGNVADRFDRFITTADSNGNLSKWINEGLDGLTNLGNTVLNLGKAFTGITEAAGGGKGLLQMLEDASEKLAVFLNSTAGQAQMKQFFSDGAALLGRLWDVAVQLGPILSGVFRAATDATNFWLPVVRECLEIINSIPGGAQAVVGAFVAWKTISGVASLAGSLNGIVNLLKFVLPGAAAEGAGGITAALAGISMPAWMSTFLAAGGSVAALPAAAAGFTVLGQHMYDNASTDDKRIGNTNVTTDDLANARTGGRGSRASEAGQTPNYLGGGGSLGAPGYGASVDPNWSPVLNAAGPKPGTYRTRDGRELPIPGQTAPPLPETPNVSSYMPPVVTEVPKGSSSTPNLPYTGTADPYGGIYTGSEYGLPQGTNTGGYGTGSAATFPPWVMALADQFGIKPSTYSGHQETDRHESGYAPNPNHENRGIDWSGPVANMQKFSDYLATIPQDLEQVIWKNPNTGQTDTIAGGRPVSGYYDASTLAEHQNHVHTRQSSPIPLPGQAGSSPVQAMYPGMSDSMGLTSSDLTLRNAGQRVNDTQHTQEQAEARLNELKAKGTATDRQLEAAEYAVAKAKREHQDAIDGLTVAQDKYNKSSEKKGAGAGGDSGAQSLGQDFLGGLGEIFGFDGSLFKDPTQFGLFKIFKGLMGLKVADNGQGTGGSGGGGGLFGGGDGGGGGIGSLLSMVPQAFGSLKVGSPQDAPGQFMPSNPGAGGTGGAVLNPFAPPGAAGPGNQQAPGGPNIDMSNSNFGYSPTAVQDQIQQGQLQSTRQPLRALPMP